MPKIRSVKPSPQMHAAIGDLNAAMRKHQDLKPIEMLALVAHFLGQLIALQDQRCYSADDIMLIVGENIAQGNQETVKRLMHPAGEA